MKTYCGTFFVCEMLSIFNEYVHAALAEHCLITQSYPNPNKHKFTSFEKSHGSLPVLSADNLYTVWTQIMQYQTKTKEKKHALCKIRVVLCVYSMRIRFWYCKIVD